MQTFSNEELSIVANAIGWAFFGEDEESGVVEVSPENSDKCLEAAKRALEQLELYRANK